MTCRIGYWVFAVGMIVGGWGCNSGATSVTSQPEKPWDQGRLDALRMTGVVEVPTDIYKKAYERALMQIDVTNMEERLAALEKEIEREREELR